MPDIFSGAAALPIGILIAVAVLLILGAVYFIGHVGTGGPHPREY